MTTATKESKSKSKRKAAQAESPPAAETTVAADAGGPVSTDSTDELGILTARLADFGFPVPRPIVDRWPAETQTQITRVVKRWIEEFLAVKNGTPIVIEDRTDVPPLLTSFEAVDELTAKKAVHEAGETATAITAESDAATLNPYPPGSALAKIWLEALTAARTKPAQPAPEPAKSTDPAPVPAAVAPAAPASAAPPTNLVTASELNQQRAERERETRLRQHQLAIEAALMELEEASRHVAEIDDEIAEAKTQMGELTASLKNARMRAYKASKALDRARDGVFDRSALPFRKGPENHPTLDVPDQDIDGKPEAAAPVAAPPSPKVDDGAFVSLDHMVKGDLQEFIPGTPEDKGISAKQCEALKKIVGENVGDLEKWQKNNGGGEWWRKALKDKGVGLGGAACDKLVEAHEIIRRKFPIPSPDDVASDVQQQSSTAPTYVLPTPEEAVERIGKLCKRAESLAATCESDSGVKFLLDVATEANKRRDTILETGKVTEAQAMAIVGWEEGIEKWAGDGAAETVSDAVEEDEAAFGEGVVEDDDSLDVPGADGDDDLDIDDDDEFEGDEIEDDELEEEDDE